MRKYINCLIYNHGGIILNSVAAIIITYNVENDFRLRINKLKGKVDEIIERYRTQLKYYKDALEKITEKRVKESYLYLFSIDEEIKVEI